MILEAYYLKAIELLKVLINTPSFSGQEDETADIIERFLKNEGLIPIRKKNNVWVLGAESDHLKPTLLLISHHDTVKPVKGWSLDPFGALEKDNKLYGLGSNDAGASLVCLLAVFLALNQTMQRYNLIYAAAAEEENSGKDGVSLIMEAIGSVDLAIVGEPTQMQMAVAEKGLMVLHCEAKGVAGHAARNEGLNALYKAIDDINWFRNYQFKEISPLLGSVKMTVTQIEAGYQHNVIPDSCKFVVDIRSNECYSNESIFEIVKENIQSEISPVSYRLNSSNIELEHPIVKKGLSLGLSYYGSPTLSDQAQIPFTSIKIGVGDSARSHTADEFVFLAEIREGIDIYFKLLDRLTI
jgi:acetylornithine deacetylase